MAHRFRNTWNGGGVGGGGGGGGGCWAHPGVCSRMDFLNLLCTVGKHQKFVITLIFYNHVLLLFGIPVVASKCFYCIETQKL